MMEINDLLEHEISVRMEQMDAISLKDKEYQTAVESVTKLIDRSIEFEKLRIDQDNHHETHDFEKKMKTEQAKDERKDSWIRNGIAVASVIIPTLVTIWGTKKSFEFEKEGTITTVMGRGFLNKLLPKK